jgi:hypothetical protein
VISNDRIKEEENMSFPGQHLQRCWHLVDASGQTTGRLASQVATLLRGKHKPTFLPNKDMGDHVVIVNAEKVRLFYCFCLFFGNVYDDCCWFTISCRAAMDELLLE